MDSDSTDTNTHDELMQLPEEITTAQLNVDELSTSPGNNAVSETENISAFVSESTSLTSSRPSHADDLETSTGAPDQDSSQTANLQTLEEDLHPAGSKSVYSGSAEATMRPLSHMPSRQNMEGLPVARTPQLGKPAESLCSTDQSNSEEKEETGDNKEKSSLIQQPIFTLDGVLPEVQDLSSNESLSKCEISDHENRSISAIKQMVRRAASEEDITSSKRKIEQFEWSEVVEEMTSSKSFSVWLSPSFADITEVKEIKFGFVGADGKPVIGSFPLAEGELPTHETFWHRAHHESVATRKDALTNFLTCKSSEWLIQFMLHSLFMEFVIPLAMPMSPSKKDSRFTQMMVVPPLAQNLDETSNDLSDLFAKLTANDRSSFSDSGEPISDSPKSTNQSLTDPFANQAKPDIFSLTNLIFTGS